MKGLILNYDLISHQDRDQSPNHAQDGSRQGDLIQFYGVLNTGKSFIWEVDRSYQIAFTKEPLKQDKWTQNGIERMIPNSFQDFRKNRLHGYLFKNRKSLHELLEQNPAPELQEYELVQAQRFLMAHAITGLVDFSQYPTSKIKTSGASFIFQSSSENHSFKPIKFSLTNNSDSFSHWWNQFNHELSGFKLKTISLDIEVGVSNQLLYSIALYGQDYRKVLMLSQGERKSENEIEYLPSEKKLLLYFLEEIKSINPHIFIGWYVANFDFNFLVRKFKEHQLTFSLGINDLPVSTFKTERSRELLIKIPGRVILEGINMVKKLYPHLPNYKLNTAGEMILGEKKIIEANDQQKVFEIERLFKEDQVRLAAYNLQDSKIVYDLFSRLKGVEFSLIRSLLSGCPMEKIDIPNEVLDHYYLPVLHRHKITSYSPQRSKNKTVPDLEAQEFKPDFYDHVWLISLQDLAPFVILTYRIDPLGMVRAQIDRAQTISTARGFSFHTKEHLLPRLLYDLAQRIDYLGVRHSKDPKDTLLTKVWQTEISQILYALSSHNSRFFLPGLSEAIKENVHFVMESVAKKLKEIPEFEILYFDNQVIAARHTKTDGLPSSVEAINQTINRQIDDDFFKQVLPRGQTDHKTFPLIQKIDYYPKFFLTSETAKLRQETSIEFKALDQADRFVSTGSKKENLKQVSLFLNQLTETILKGSDLEKYLKEFKQSLLAGKFDHDLIYSKRLTKDLKDYTPPFPPQVEAAKKISEELEERKKLNLNTSRINYYQTVEGPEPQQKRLNKIDYQYYLDKEFIPSLEKLLGNTQFKSYIHLFKSDDFQLSLF